MDVAKSIRDRSIGIRQIVIAAHVGAYLDVLYCICTIQLFRLLLTVYGSLLS